VTPLPGRTLPVYFAVLGYAVVSLIVIAALLELTSFVAWSAYRRVHPVFPELRATSPVYAGEPWAPEFLQEELSRQKSRKVYAPFRLWAVTSWHGKYVNNDEAEGGTWRRTVNPVSSACSGGHRAKLWVFGGSTVYGTGVPDWGTLPSYLSRDLNAAGRDCVMVWNLGVEGYVSNQELLLLLERLKTGQRPDIVVFYDGVNDASDAGPRPGAPSPHFYYGLIKSRIEGSVSGRLDFVEQSYAMRLSKAILSSRHFLRSSPLPAAQLQAKATATLNNYEANLQFARALSKAFNFKLYWFWQPALFYGHKPMVAFEKNVVESASSEQDKNWSLVIAEVYQEAERRAARTGDFVFLGGVFDSVREPVYIDQAHLGPLGNELAAGAVAKYIEEHPEN
jgi:lysophospholipase L1-like esterase